MAYDYKTILDNLRTNQRLAAYILGAFMTDGYVYYKSNKAAECGLVSKDSDWLELISRFLGGSIPVTSENNQPLHRIRLYNIAVAEWLVRGGCVPNKSLTLKFPEVESEYLPDFIRGCMDGDGSISLSRYLKKGNYYPKITVYLCGSARQFLEDFQQKLEVQNIRSNFLDMTSYKRGKAAPYKAPHYRVSMNGKHACKFLRWVYYPEHEVSMPRKRLKVQAIFDL